MKLLAAIFAVIVLFAAPLGFFMDANPIVALLGRVAAVIALAGLAAAAVVHAMDDLIPSVDFDVEDIHP